MGAVLLARGDLDGAYNALAESLLLGRGTAPRILIASALEGLGCVMAARAKAQESAKIFGTAALMREQMGASMRPSDKPAYERALKNVLMMLGVDAYSAAHAEGRLTPPEQVVSRIVTSLQA